MKMALLVLFTTLLSIFLPTIHGSDVEFQWQILSSNNFSSQIRLHPHVLLFITVPWCGESRSLMNEISQQIAKEKDKYSSLKLMLVYRNFENKLADSFGASEGISIFCYHHSVSYKYKGILRARNVLSSAFYLWSLSVEDLPLNRLSNSKDLETFRASTDTSVVLVESCGWTSRLLLEQTGNETLQGDSVRETNHLLASGRKSYFEDAGDDRKFEVQHGYGDIPWVGEFSAENVTASPIDEDMKLNLGLSCSFEEYIKFKSFFSKFMISVRENYLPPQKQRYGFVSDRSLLLTLGIEDIDQWSLVISYAGCPGCLRKFKDENFLQNALENHNLPVMELSSDEKGHELALPIDKPSVILFVDRTSEYIETRTRSEQALHVFKELAVRFWKPNSTDWKSSFWPRQSLHTYHRSTNIFKNQRLILSPSSQRMIKDKMSIMIINERKQVTLSKDPSNLQDGALHDILEYLTGQKESKLSSLAEEAGFQLLSDEVDLKITDALSSQEESINQDSSNDFANDDAPLVDQNQQFLSTNIQASNEYNNQKAYIDSASEESGIVDPHQSLNDYNASSLDVELKMETDGGVDDSDGLGHLVNAFAGSFFFCDGNYKFLRSLTNSLELPRTVIIDPLSQQHYVLSEDANFSVHSVSTFINAFLNGSLTPYQRSGPFHKSIEVPRPPFVNLDFREKNSIPSVTADTFSELVIGSSYSNAQDETNAWNKDVIVIFTSTWCGFCQRMELVVREVYRALKGCINMIESDSKSMDLFSQEDWKDVSSKLPAFYLLDCTLNECSWILRSLGQREVYPSLLLFPAESKTPITYDGSMTVTDIIKFIAINGSKSQHLTRLKGMLWTDQVDKELIDEKFKVPLMNGSRSSDTKDKLLETISQNPEVQSTAMSELDEQAPPLNPTIGSFLVATELVHELNPFHKATILIVGADHLGFQGLIINKPLLSWDPQFEYAKLLEGAPVSFGGPVIQHEMPLVSLTKVSLNNQHLQVLPGVYFLGQSETLDRIQEIKAGNQSASELWFFWGYSGWSWDQLLSEIAQGVWTLNEGNNDHLKWPQ